MSTMMRPHRCLPPPVHNPVRALQPWGQGVLACCSPAWLYGGQVQEREVTG